MTKQHACGRVLSPGIALSFTLSFALSCGAGCGGSNGPGWVQLFNGVDLTGWQAKISHYPVGENYANTFRVKNGVIQVSYDDYDATGFGGNEGKFGLLYWTTPLSKFRLRVEYRFTGPQAPNPPAWGLRNSGLMVFGEDPAGVGVDVIYPSILEIQLLGRDNTGNTNNGNLCPLGGSSAMLNGIRVMDGCTGSTSLPFAANPNFADDAWVTVEAEVHGSGDTKVTFAGDNNDRPVLVFSQPMAMMGGPLLDRGFIALQSESHPIEFRKVEMMELKE
ncbi:MAG: DUF1080 domain-containing protein [Myxococcales bacterium]